MTLPTPCPACRAVCCTLLCGLFFAPDANALQLLVPAYANPCCAGGPAMWSSLVSSAQAHGGKIQLIFNPASGPGVSPVDPNYVNGSGQGVLLNFRNAGGGALGYAATDFARRPSAEVRADIDTYYSADYWRGVGVQIDGIFLDEMSNDLANVPYYQALRDYVHAKDSAAKVVGNPGTGFVTNPSQQVAFSVSDYAQSVDTLMSFEGSGSDYRNNYQEPDWVRTFPHDHFAHVIYAETLPAAMAQDLTLAAQRAGLVYVTDDALQPNPYDQIPTYWQQQVALAITLGFVDGFEGATTAVVGRVRPSGRNPTKR